MTDISKVIHPAVKQWMDKNLPAQTVQEARLYFTTMEILSACQDILFDDSLSEVMLFNFLTQSGYHIVDLGGIQRWIIK